jgi:hypothetical protein
MFRALAFLTTITVLDRLMFLFDLGIAFKFKLWIVCDGLRIPESCTVRRNLVKTLSGI